MVPVFKLFGIYQKRQGKTMWNDWWVGQRTRNEVCSFEAEEPTGPLVTSAWSLPDWGPVKLGEQGANHRNSREPSPEQHSLGCVPECSWPSQPSPPWHRGGVFSHEFHWASDGWGRKLHCLIWKLCLQGQGASHALKHYAAIMTTALNVIVGTEGAEVLGES